MNSSNSFSTRRSPGFSRTEMVVIIAIIVILALVAIPRFMNHAENVNAKMINNLAGSINDAVALVQAQYADDHSKSNNTAITVMMKGKSVAVIAGTGRPAATEAGIGAVVKVPGDFAASYAKGMATYNFATAMPDCNVVYTAATGEVAVTSTGCK